MRDQVIFQLVKDAKAEILARLVKSEDKILQQHTYISSTFTLLKNYEARLAAVQEILLEKALVTEDQMNEMIDTRIGLRLKADTEEIVKGDIAWVHYKAKIEGQEEEQEDTLPLRVGSGAVILEEAVIGKKPNTSGHVYENIIGKDPSNGDHAGKKMVFTFDILKVKTHIAPEGEGNGTKIEAPADAGGSEHKESGSNPG
jgi:FKBP-type peptidyl-prolyl cis-trans isomerase (trigger factor)